jgi:hypothetical protein
VEAKKTDLSKLSLEDLRLEWEAIRRGTPLGTLFVIVSKIVAAIVFIVGISIGVKKVFFDNSEIVSHGQDHISAIVSASSPGYGAESDRAAMSSEIKKRDESISLQAEKIKDLQAKVDALTEQLNRRPDGYRCTIYDGDLNKLRVRKDEVEQYIQTLLRPPQTREQAAAGVYYTVEQLDVFAKQAAEYRKQASDIQEQIKGIESNRAQCKS